MINSPTKKRILNISEAARYSGYSRGWIESWIYRGLLPFESPPSQGTGKQNRKYIRRADLDSFLDQNYHRIQPKVRRKGKTGGSDLILLPRNI